MSKESSILSRFGGNLAESMGANRQARGVASAPVAAAPSRHDGTGRLRSGAEIAVDRIMPDPNQPRTEFDPDAITRLAESLISHGQLQPITVRWSEDTGRYLIVTGERRWRASVQAGRPTLAAVVLEGERSESEILEMQLVENCLREDLKPVEQARAYKTLIDRNGWTAARLSEVLHVTGASVSRALSLLDLPSAVQEAVESGDLAPSVAYEVSKLDDAAAQQEVAAMVVSRGLNREQTADVVRRRAPKAKGRAKSKAGPFVHRADNGLTVTVAPSRGKPRALTAEETIVALRAALASLETADAGATQEAA